MNGKKAKALRRLERALEQEKLAFQEMLRRGTPVPVKTMSMDDFNKARSQVAEGGVAVISTTPRTPDIDEDNLALEETEAAAIEQEVKLRLLQQNAKHYIGIDELEMRVLEHFDVNDKMTLTREEVVHNGRTYKLTSAHGDGGVAVPVFPDNDIPQVGGYLKEPKTSPDPLHARRSVVFERSPAMIDLIDKTQERLADIRKGDKTDAS